MRNAVCIVLLFLVFALALASAQEAEKPAAEPQKPVTEALKEHPPSPPRLTDHYRLEFSINELHEGKVLNSRQYSMLVPTTDRGSLRFSTRVPVVLSPGTGGAPPQYSYVNAGLTLTCSARPVSREDRILVNTDLEIESFGSSDQTLESRTPMPITRTITAKVPAYVSLGKPTVVASLDDPNSKRRFQIEVTATRMK